MTNYGTFASGCCNQSCSLDPALAIAFAIELSESLWHICQWCFNRVFCSSLQHTCLCLLLLILLNTLAHLVLTKQCGTDYSAHCICSIEGVVQSVTELHIVKESNKKTAAKASSSYAQEVEKNIIKVSNIEAEVCDVADEDKLNLGRFGECFDRYDVAQKAFNS